MSREVFLRYDDYAEGTWNNTDAEVGIWCQIYTILYNKYSLVHIIVSLTSEIVCKRFI